MNTLDHLEILEGDGGGRFLHAVRGASDLLQALLLPALQDHQPVRLTRRLGLARHGDNHLSRHHQALHLHPLHRHAPGVAGNLKRR